MAIWPRKKAQVKGEAQALLGPEIYIALCGAAGTNQNQAIAYLEAELSSYNYTVNKIVLSDYFHDLPGFDDLKKGGAEEVRIKRSMEAGNFLRKNYGADAVSRIAVQAIRDFREMRSEEKSADSAVLGTAHIVKSLKRPEEYEFLSELYGDAFAMFSIYEPKDKRIENLASVIARSHKSQDTSKYIDAAKELVETDEKEASVSAGQGLRDVFPLADVFVNAGGSLKKEIERAVGLMFGAPFITPTRNEYGMFHAFASALKSADLSRQVGAVIATPESEIISTGCNDVPKAGGGVIWEEDVTDDLPDRRDFALGGDASALLKREMFEEIFYELMKKDWLSTKVKVDNFDEFITDVIAGRKEVKLKGARISNIIEFGRIVHAEMSALMEAARKGSAVKGSILYCTTFPCHMCARHIIAAGISEVFYIEPYPKSMAKRLYAEEICVDGDPIPKNPSAVKFRPFVGIAPKRYAKWFAMRDRKTDDGLSVDSHGSLQARRIARIVDLPPVEEALYGVTTEMLEKLEGEPRDKD